MKISVFLAAKGNGTDDRRMRQVCFRVREGASDLRVRSGLLANEDYWDESIPGYRRTTKLPKREINGLNKKNQDITVLIHEQFSENRDGSWLRCLVRNYLENGTENWATSVSSLSVEAPALKRLFHRTVPQFHQRQENQQGKAVQFARNTEKAGALSGI